MTPDWHSMIAALLVFVVLPLALVGIPSIVMRCKARSQRLFVDLPNKRIGPPRPPSIVIDHRWDGM